MQDGAVVSTSRIASSPSCASRASSPSSLSALTMTSPSAGVVLDDEDERAFRGAASGYTRISLASFSGSRTTMCRRRISMISRRSRSPARDSRTRATRR